MHYFTPKSVFATLALSSVSLAIMAHAAEAAEAEGLEEVVVTGSAIPLPPDEATASVQSLDSAAIAQTGVNSNVLDILRKAMPEIAGRGNTGAANANNTNQKTFGGSQLLLNNTDTLVLVNGRRVAYSGTNAITNGKNFVDVGQFPAAAIDHIEVLDDGASAIYGSDAVGGVVNIILKSNQKGGEVGTRFGVASGYAEQSGFASYGDSIGKFNFSAAVSLSHTDPLAQSDRPFSAGVFGTVTNVPGSVAFAGNSPGAMLASGILSPSRVNPTGIAARASSVGQLVANGTYVPGTPASIRKAYGVSTYQQLLLEQNQQGFSTTWTADLAEHLSAFGDVDYGHTTTWTQFKPTTVNVTAPAGSPFNPLMGPFPGVGFGYPPIGNTYSTDANAVRFTVGLRGDIMEGWNWEAAYVHSENDLSLDIGGLFYNPNVGPAIAGGYDANGNKVAGGAYSLVYAGFSKASQVIQPALDPFAIGAGVNPASLNNLVGTEHISAHSQLDSLDVKVTGKLFQLPGGTVQIATGVAVRREAESSSTDAVGTNQAALAGNGWINGVANDPFSKGRNIGAAFLESRIPVTGDAWNFPGFHTLDIVLAGRVERYSDAGNSDTPQVGVRWQPFDPQVTFRGTYSRSFTAPTLAAMFGPTDVRQIGTGVIQNTFGLPNLAFNGMDGNNPNLRPSRAETRSLSAQLAPKFVKNLVLTARYSMIDQVGIPAGIGFNNILASVNAQGAASPFSRNLAMNAFPGQPGAVGFSQPGQVLAYLRANPTNSNNLYAIDQFQNDQALKIRTINLTASYLYDADKWGLYNFSTTSTIFKTFQLQALPIQRFYEYAGTATNQEGTIPNYRFYTIIDGAWGNWEGMVANTFISSSTDLGTGGATPSPATHVKAYTIWDLRLGYNGEQTGIPHLNNWRLAVGINNVFNRMPPLSPNAFTDNLADVGTYSPIGRLGYVQASVKF